MPIELAPIVKLNGTSMSAEWMAALIDVRVELELQLPGRATLRFVDPGYGLLADGTVALGTEVSVAAPDGTSLIVAEVTGIEVQQPEGEQPEMVVVAHDRAHRMARATKVSTYLNMTYSDVVTKVVQEYGMSASTDSSQRRIDYLLQVDSDLGLVSELAGRIGFDWWVEDKTFNFKQPAETTTVELTLHDGLRSFSVRATGHHPDSVQVAGWDRQKQAVVTATAPLSAATVKASSDLADKVASPGSAFGTATMATAGVAAANATEATEMSGVLRDRAVASSVTARGVALGNGAIRPGVTVSVSGAGPLSGTYPVTRVEQVFRPATGMVTRFWSGDRRPSSLVDALSGGRTSTAPATSHPGLVVGTVTNNKDEFKSGRVKVRYPGLSDTDESAWARLTAVGGGKSRGMVSVPEVDDEVLVAFEGGDPRQPVVIGGLFGDKVAIPSWDVEDNGAVNSRGLTSRLGHVMQLSDGTEDSTQFLLLQLAGKQHTLRIGKDSANFEVPAGIPLTIKSGQASIAFDDQGAVTISGTKVTIKGTESVELSAPKGSFKADAQLDLQGAQTSVKGTMVAIEGQGMASVKGGIVAIN
jgi:uncharacterized protein involved in type VI secretion and phage assembly